MMTQTTSPATMLNEPSVTSTGHSYRRRDRQCGI